MYMAEFQIIVCKQGGHFLYSTTDTGKCYVVIQGDRNVPDHQNIFIKIET